MFIHARHDPERRAQLKIRGFCTGLRLKFSQNLTLIAHDLSEYQRQLESNFQPTWILRYSDTRTETSTGHLRRTGSPLRQSACS
jgi:hypothetical protein